MRSSEHLTKTMYQEEDTLDSLIIANRKLEAMQLLRERFGLSIGEALEALTARYRELRTASPDQFTYSDAEYWEGFYS